MTLRKTKGTHAQTDTLHNNLLKYNPFLQYRSATFGVTTKPLLGPLFIFLQQQAIRIKQAVNDCYGSSSHFRRYS